VILSKLKTYGLVAAGAVMAALVVAVKWLTVRNSRLSRRAETAEARVNHARVVDLADNEIEEQTRSRRADALKELEDTGGSSDFRDPNRLFNDDDST